MDPGNITFLFFRTMCGLEKLELVDQNLLERTGGFLRENMTSDYGLFSFYEGHKERRTGKIRGAFSKMPRSLDGWMLARAPTSPAAGLHHHGPRCYNFPFFLYDVRP